MSSGKQKLKIEQKMALSQVIAYLEDLAVSLKAGNVHACVGDESMTLTPPGVVGFELVLSRKKDTEKITLELRWKDGSDAVLISGNSADKS